MSDCPTKSCEKRILELERAVELLTEQMSHTQSVVNQNNDRITALEDSQ